MWFIYINYFNLMQRPFHLLTHLSEHGSMAVFDSLHYKEDAFR
jgi:hypothetical protein